MLSRFSYVWLFATLWTVAHQAPLSLGFPGKNTGVDCHALRQAIFPTQESNPHLLCLTLADGFFSTRATWEILVLCLLIFSLYWLRPSVFYFCLSVSMTYLTTGPKSVWIYDPVFITSWLQTLNKLVQIPHNDNLIGCWVATLVQFSPRSVIKLMVKLLTPSIK